MFNFGVEFISDPHLRVYWTDRQADSALPVGVPLHVAMVRLLAITERYLIFRSLTRHSLTGSRSRWGSRLSVTR